MAIFSQGGSDSVAASSRRSAWIGAGAILVVAAAALCGVFAAEARGAFEVWVESTAYNHCFLVVPVAAYLAWTRRGSLERFAPRPELRWLLLLVPLGLLWMAAARISILEVQQLVVMTMFQVIALSVLGWTAYRVMLTPFLYLFFLVPTGYFLVPYLQQWTAAFAVAALKLVGIPVYSDGMFIEVPSGNFVVAEACAGLRFLIASVAFGVFFAALMYRSRVRWLGFVALSIVVPIIANGFRAFGIIALSEATGNAAAVEADHIIYGWGFFTAVTLLLIVIGMRFADDQAPAGALLPPPAAGAHPPARWPWGAAAAGVLGVALAASAPAYAQFRDWRASDVAAAGAFAPPPSGSWKPASPAAFGWKPVIDEPDREFLGAYGSERASVALYIAFYKEAGFHNNLVRGTNNIVDGKNWRLVSDGRTTAPIGGVETAIASSEIARPDGRRMLVWHFYVVDGHVAAGPLQAKLLQLRHFFGAGERSDAFVAVAAYETVSVASAQDALRSFLADFTPPGVER